MYLCTWIGDFSSCDSDANLTSTDNKIQAKVENDANTSLGWLIILRHVLLVTASTTDHVPAANCIVG
uniref:Uncharacterized protein n=1 Tax=Octopus bimaculoides TaxID=37653 RepID=A0A0L8GHL0_OCTBM